VSERSKHVKLLCEIEQWKGGLRRASVCKTVVRIGNGGLDREISGGQLLGLEAAGAGRGCFDVNVDDLLLDLICVLVILHRKVVSG
jgi:hypothetical protein